MIFWTLARGVVGAFLWFCFRNVVRGACEESAGFELFFEEGKDSGVLVGKGLVGAVRHFEFSECFCCIVIGKWIVVSVHLPNSWTDKKNEHVVEVLVLLEESILALSKRFKVERLLLGGDLNVQIPAASDVSGGVSTFCPRRVVSDRQVMVTEFLQKHKLKVLNTYPAGCHGGSPGDVWTHFNNRHGTTTQIDFICVSDEVSGEAGVVRDWEMSRVNDDHRPVLGDGLRPAAMTNAWTNEVEWKGVQAVGEKSDPGQRREQWRHPRPGRRSMWEDSLVQRFGLHWAAVLQLDDYASYASRRHQFVDFCVEKYAAARLQRLACGELHCEVATEDGDVEPGLSCAWELDAQLPRFEIVGDSDLLVNWVNGDYAKRSGGAQELVQEAMKDIHLIVSKGLGAFRTKIAPPMRHVRRRWNQEAAQEANKFISEPNAQGMMPHGSEIALYSHLRVTFDGASRKGERAAAGFVV